MYFNGLDEFETDEGVRMNGADVAAAEGKMRCIGEWDLKGKLRFKMTINDS